MPNQYANTIVMGILLLLTSGCGSSDGPRRYELSGKVTFQGQPVALGEIMFEPDTSRGNSGPGLMAEILEGVYHTPKGKGTVGGPHVLRIMAGNGEGVTVLAPFGKYLGKRENRLKVDLPREDGEYDLDIGTLQD